MFLSSGYLFYYLLTIATFSCLFFIKSNKIFLILATFNNYLNNLFYVGLLIVNYKLYSPWLPFIYNLPLLPLQFIIFLPLATSKFYFFNTWLPFIIILEILGCFSIINYKFNLTLATFYFIIFKPWLLLQFNIYLNWLPFDLTLNTF